MSLGYSHTFNFTHLLSINETLAEQSTL